MKSKKAKITTKRGVVSAPGCWALKDCQFAVSDILQAALSGLDKTLRTPDGYVRWGEVEFRIRCKIADHWPNPQISRDGGMEAK